MIKAIGTDYHSNYNSENLQEVSSGFPITRPNNQANNLHFLFHIRSASNTIVKQTKTFNLRFN